MVTVDEKTYRNHQVRSIGALGVLRLRAGNPLLSDRSARCFAQDDGLVGVLKKPSGWVCKKHKINKATDSRDDSSVGPYGT
jgi:hypothetical protein